MFLYVKGFPDDPKGMVDFPEEEVDDEDDEDPCAHNVAKF